MNFWFSGSYTQEQAAGAIRVRDALTLDLDGWPITVELAFTEDPDPSQPDEFAITQQIAFDHYLISFRNDAPHFHNGPSAAHYDIARFYQETVAHELGHAFSFSFNDAGKELLSRLFGVENSTEAWFPAANAWQDRAGEAIAETFKDAFLPYDFREYDNRTNIQLHYSYLPFFRAIFRNAVTEGMLRDVETMLQLPSGTLGSVPTIGLGEGELPPGETEVEGYDFDVFSHEHAAFWDGVYGSEIPPTYIQADPEEGMYDTIQAGFGVGTTIGGFGFPGDFRIFGASQLAAWVKDGTELSFHLDVDLDSLAADHDTYTDTITYGPFTDTLTFYRGLTFDMIEYRNGNYPFGSNAPPDWSSGVADDTSTKWWYDPDGVLSSEDGRDSGWSLVGSKAVEVGAPPTGIDQTITVDDRWTQTITCGGETYRFVQIIWGLAIFMPFPHTDDLTIRQAYIDQWDDLRLDEFLPRIPTMQFTQPGCFGGSSPITSSLPEGELLPGGHESGSKIVRTPVSGSKIGLS